MRKVQKRGKILRKATYAIIYGASPKTVAKTAGLGLRRSKVLAKCFTISK